MKPEKIKFIDANLETAFNSLSEKDPLKKSLAKAIEDIKENCFSGRNVKKKLIPKKLIDKYKVNNLWIYNLPFAWRMLYSITTTKDIKIIAVLLD